MTITQPDLFTTAAARRDGALAAVEAAADEAWKAEAWDLLVTYLEQHAEFHVDQLWSAGLSTPRESRALGPIILRAARKGLMVRSGQYRPSVRSNLSEKPVWTSLIHHGGGHAAAH